MPSHPDFAAASRLDFQDIPIIDVSDIDDPHAFRRISANLLNAAETVGFFYLKGHSIPEHVIEAAFSASRAFFELPESDKATVAVDTNQRGWMAQGMSTLEGSKTHDAKEVFFWGWDVSETSSDFVAGLPLVALNQWPDRVAPDFRIDVMAYYENVVELGRKVLSALAVGLGQSVSFFEAPYQSPLARGQLVYYPPVTERDLEAERFSAAEHSDFGVLTLLMQDMQGGLQVKNRDGGWVNAPPIAGTFVCNIGDLLEHWTGGRLVSTKHRVINLSGNARYSIPVFCDPNSATIIDPADFGCSGENSVTAGAYIVGKNKRNFTHYKA